jgi:hypothetical protein
MANRCPLVYGDHRLELFGEDPAVGKDASTAAWRG